MILLHGFPEAWFGWQHQIPALAAAGYRVWAPDQRGYNLSDKPTGIKAYQINTLAADIVGLIDAAQVETACIVGHDWGAAVAWWLALQYPERVERLVVINVPHPTVMRDFLRHNWRQRFRSWYVYFFQLPGVPELGGSFGELGGVGAIAPAQQCPQHLYRGDLTALSRSLVPAQRLYVHAELVSSGGTISA